MVSGGDSTHRLKRSASRAGSVRTPRSWWIAVAVWTVATALTLRPLDAQPPQPPAAHQHWAFQAPIRPQLPTVSQASWPRNPIDYFVLAELDRRGLQPNPPADPSTLARRTALAITGLPHLSGEQFSQAAADHSQADAMDPWVDRLLASPSYGEHQARYWLDAARYADTHGLNLDNERSIWPYRDWVIDSFNANMPFDQFTVEQLAGDLLKSPTTDQLVATGFSRCNVTTGEGGAIDEEYRALYAAERVETVATVWMGLTANCARCHDHKHDPLSQREFYSLTAYFNSLTERGLDGNALSPAPSLNVPTRLQRAALRQIETELAELETAGPSTEDGSAAGRRRALQQAIRRLKSEYPSTLIMEELQTRRPTFVLERGEYDQRGEQVERGVPSFLPPLPADAPDNRLGLARWLVASNHPLTARVTVNRIWQQYFGVGLVKTAEDFGLHGEPPSHPELLDWLAAELIANGWNIKAIHRLIATSATFRQSSSATPEAYAADPENRWLARGPRYRLDAEVIRDQTLAASGLLVGVVGGRSVRPYQPAGIWERVAYPTSTTAKYEPDSGPSLFRRSLYTFWKRSAPPPAMLLLDAPSREICTVRRARTNSPSAALMLMNDPQFVEAARRLAERALLNSDLAAAEMTDQPTLQVAAQTDELAAHQAANPSTDGASSVDQRRLTWLCRQALGREPKESETSVWQKLLDHARARFRESPALADELIRVGSTTPDSTLDRPELAAWTVITNTVFNLDEFLSLH
ncbi:MAG: DUF1549 and DUF1553 domain-containing protein [Pirellulales bacterium]